MSFGFGLTITIAASVVIALLIGQICHIGDLDKDPLDGSVAKPPDGAFLRVVDSQFQRKY
jgi:hypothetical protein